MQAPCISLPGIGKLEGFAWSATPVFPSQGTNLIEPLQEHTQTEVIFAHFIDEYRLFGTVGPGPETTLWDSAGTRNPQDLPGLVFELGPDYGLGNNEDRDTHEMNHVLPFRESSSMSITGFMVYTKHSTVTKKLLIIPVRNLISFACRMGTTTYVPWQDWLHFATLIELPPVSPRMHIFHSHVLNVHRAVSSTEPRSILRVWDFSFRSRRRQAQDDPSAPLPPYTMREILFDAKYYHPMFQITEGGVLITRVRIQAIVRHAKVLI